MSLSEGMIKQIVIRLYYGILLGNKKAQTIVTASWMNLQGVMLIGKRQCKGYTQISGSQETGMGEGWNRKRVGIKGQQRGCGDRRFLDGDASMWIGILDIALQFFKMLSLGEYAEFLYIFFLQLHVNLQLLR